MSDKRSMSLEEFFEQFTVVKKGIQIGGADGGASQEDVVNALHALAVIEQGVFQIVAFLDMLFSPEPSDLEQVTDEADAGVQ